MYLPLASRERAMDDEPMTSSLDDLLPPIPDDRLSITPSALGQFIRFEQCQRLFRLDLLAKAERTRLFEATDTRHEFVPPLLAATGNDWEVEFSEMLVNAGWHHQSLRDKPAMALTRYVQRAEAGTSLVLTQADLSGNLDGWEVTRSRPDVIVVDRQDDGRLRLMIADLKSSRDVRLEHRLQVAMYAMLLAQSFPEAEITEAVIYRAPVEQVELWTDEQRRHREMAHLILRLDSGVMLALADRPERYHDQIRRAILAPGSRARQIAAATYSTLPFHVSSKCDGCGYSQLCLRSCRQNADLSLIPHLSERTKRSVLLAGVDTIDALAGVRERLPEAYEEMVENPLVAPQLSEIIQRAWGYLAWQAGERQIETWLDDKGHSSLPAASANHHPNLIKICLDLQVDGSQGRLYLIAAQVTCLVDGVERPDRQRTIIEMTEGPPLTDAVEAALVRTWLRKLIQAVTELASPDEEGKAAAPLHFYLWDDAQRAVLVNLINRQHEAVFGIEAVMALMMQTAAFDSNNLSIVTSEVRAQRALPMLCQTLQAVAPWFGFTWPAELRARFRHRVFDALDVDSDRQDAQLVPFRARFRSDLPAEYAYVAWGEHTSFRSAEQPDPESFRSSWGLYGQPTRDEIIAFQAARLDALRTIAGGLVANNRARKSSFDLAALSWLGVRPETLIEAVREFIAIERHQELSEWRRIRSDGQAIRVLRGDSLVVRYRDEDQLPAARVKIREARERQARWEARRSADPEATREKEDRWSLDGLEVRLRIDEADLPDSLRLEIALLNTRIREESYVTVAPALSSFLPEGEDEAVTFQTTARQILGGFRGEVIKLRADGTIEVNLRQNFASFPGFVFWTSAPPFEDGDRWVIDESPDSWPSKRQYDVVESIRGGRPHAAYDWIAGRASAAPAWSDLEADGQRRYLDGLVLLSTLDGRVKSFEASKHVLIGSGGGERMMLVQGPPGTGKSTTTGYALWARVQGAVAAGRPFRVAVVCKTHAATDVLVRSILASQMDILDIARGRGPEVDALIDQRVRDVPVYRYEPDDGVPPSGARVVKTRSAEGHLREICACPQVIVGGTTNAIGKLATKAWKQGEPPWDLLIVDEASQMSLPEFLTAGVGLKADGRMIVVGDHRQMPPIIKANWEEGETIAVDPFAVHRSVFDIIRHSPQPKTEIKFEESFRIHRDVAEYLKREVYQFDGIDFFSRRTPHFTTESAEAFSAAVLRSPQPLILVTHDEGGSQQRNPLEQRLILSILGAIHLLDPRPSMGVVVPHRAQRAALRKRLIELTGDDHPANSVDTIERFQGNERDVIIYGATESDPAYLRDTGTFLFDPRRLTVAISRATHKLIVIAAENIFEYLPPDEESLENSAIWRNLREYACPDVTWTGALDGYLVTVRTSAALAPDQSSRR